MLGILSDHTRHRSVNIPGTDGLLPDAELHQHDRFQVVNTVVTQGSDLENRLVECGLVTPSLSEGELLTQAIDSLFGSESWLMGRHFRNR